MKHVLLRLITRELGTQFSAKSLRSRADECREEQRKIWDLEELMVMGIQCGIDPCLLIRQGLQLGMVAAGSCYLRKEERAVWPG